MLCRFQSGFFFRHPLTLDYDYYWRIEPDVDYYCELDYDVFAFMEAKDLKYGNPLIASPVPYTQN
jgi:alpha 1,2-mannosyltransferase